MGYMDYTVYHKGENFPVAIATHLGSLLPIIEEYLMDGDEITLKYEDWSELIDEEEELCDE